MFRKRCPIAWTFHRNTSRWPYNILSVSDTSGQPPPYKEYFDVPIFQLPDPQFPATTLRQAIEARRSCRRFSAAPVRVPELASLLQSAYGIEGQIFFGDQEFLERPVPSGGGLYPLELYLLIQHAEDLESGIYHYAVLSHALEQLRVLQLPRQLIVDLFLGQPYLRDAAVIVVLTTVLERSLWKYGDRGYRYLLLEAGHVAQNLNLVATALGLGSFNIGGFFDSDLANLLGLDIEEEIPLYGIALGTPFTDDRTDLRQPLD